MGGRENEVKETSGEILVFPSGELLWRGEKMRCALGRSGVSEDKKEGDGATPVGSFPVRKVFYRADRVGENETALPARPIGEDDGWCDDPGDPDYNRPVTLPHPARHERMWREDNLYDIVVVLGYNDDPPISGKGSGIFLHAASGDYAPTEGCVAVSMKDLVALVREVSPGAVLRVLPPGGASAR
jgi:L,D-peptidoglycan transpeptidase YkuD (ErfK/YbiS/YcfS/YnhG family)